MNRCTSPSFLGGAKGRPEAADWTTAVHQARHDAGQTAGADRRPIAGATTLAARRTQARAQSRSWWAIRAMPSAPEAVSRTSATAALGG
jgi:hypothetical protein